MWVVIGFAVCVITAIIAGGHLVTKALRNGKVANQKKTGLATVIVYCLLLLVILAFGAWLRFDHTPAHHVMYLDEPWYIQAANAMLSGEGPVLCEGDFGGEKCEPFPKALGWPSLLSGVFWVSGVTGANAIALNRFLGLLAILLAAACARLAGGNWFQVLAAATLMAMFPSHAGWSATAETNIAASVFLLGGICGVLAFLRQGGWPAALLSASGLAAAATVRPELLATLVPAGVALALSRHAGEKTGNKLLFPLPLAGAAIFAGAAMLSLWGLYTDISGGAFLSPGDFLENMAAMACEPGFAASYIVLIILGIAGLVSMLLSDKRSYALVLGSTFLLTAAAALSYDLFMERMLVAPVAILIPAAVMATGLVPAAVAGKGRALVLNAVFTLVLVSVATAAFLPGFSRIAHPPDTQLLEYRLAPAVASARLPADSLLLAEYPAVLMTTREVPVVMATDKALAGGNERLAELAAQRPVYFLCDMYCEPGFEGADKPVACGRILRGFRLVPEIEIGLHDRKYGLYRISGPRDPSEPSIGCPFQTREPGAQRQKGER